MINIPEEIKQLLKDGSVRKNFRVHFPNGERADITNENVVSESVTLTESLCSQSQLQFGLCDKAEIQFETFGVGNIKGSIIECSIEIYCDSSVQGSVYKEDIDANVYPIPYGTFVVASCKKQADMTHREVVAYGGNTVQGNQLPKSVVNGLAIAMLKSNKQKLSFDTMFKCLKPGQISDYSSISGTSEFKSSHIDIYDRDGKLVTFVRITYAPFVIQANANEQNVIAFKPYYMYPPDELDNLINRLNEKVAEIKRQGGYSTRTSDTIGSLASYYAKKTTPPQVVALFPGSDYFDYSDIDDIFDVRKDRYIVAIDWEDSKQIYSTAMKLEASGSGAITRSFNYIYLPHTFSFEDGTTISLRRNITGGSGFNCSYKVLPLFASTDELSVSTTYIQKSKKDVIAPSTYIFSKETIVQKWNDYVQAYYELQGKFGNYARDGVFKSITVNSDEIAETLTKGDYESLWYDDDYCKLIGAARIQYNDSNKEDVVQTVEFVTDYNDKLYRTYDMSGNKLISLNKLSDNAITEILETAGESMTGIRYMPSNISMMGMPHIEVGDKLIVETETDGDITILVEKRVLSGIQSLMDSIECVDEVEEDISSMGYDIDTETIVLGR